MVYGREPSATRFAAEPAGLSDRAESGRTLLIGAGAVCFTILVIKLLLIWRININWDEFFFLSHVHALSRGELAQMMQTSYAHLFRWLVAVDGDEAFQVVLARVVMLAFLAVTCLLIWKLARRWTSAPLATLAPLCYLAMLPVVRHGASFRADSLLAPLTLAAVLLFLDRSRDRVRLYAAGVCFGLAVALSVKAVLLLPVLMALAFFEHSDAGSEARARPLAVAQHLLALGFIAALVAGATVWLHARTLAQVAGPEAGVYVSSLFEKSLLNVPFLPQRSVLEATLRADLLSWLLIFGGVAAAILRRRYAPLALALSLLPILFYRNAFSYYYLVMLAPACVFAALAGESAFLFLKDVLGRAPAKRLLLVMGIAVTAQAAIHLLTISDDEQSRQRVVIAAVHKIFPRPVAYIDHSGMIASFSKVNFFMSTWGLQTYRTSGRSFMREAIDRHRAPLLLANRPILDPDSPSFAALLPEDRRLIREFYPRYWGPIRVAGAEVVLTNPDEAALQLPYPGRYRLRSAQPVTIANSVYHDGQLIDVAEPASINVRAASLPAGGLLVRLFWANALLPPRVPAPLAPLYTPL